MTSPLRAFGAATLAVLTLGTAACNDDPAPESSPAPSESPAPTPEEALSEALHTLAADPYSAAITVEVEGERYLEGSMTVLGEDTYTTDTDLRLTNTYELFERADIPGVDLEGLKAYLADLSVSTVAVEGETYHRMAGGPYSLVSDDYADDTWFHRPSSARDEFGVAFQIKDAAYTDYAKQVLAAMQAPEGSPEELTGTLPVGDPVFDLLLATYEGVPEADVPVSVTLDEDGRLSDLAFSLAIDEVDFGPVTLDYRIEVSDWGTEAEIATPEGEVVEGQDLLDHYRDQL
ncbi:hypothetical protein [Salininema proteolyticum]|uniref:Lipoprotein n=1 Tax=Salininema proteolyticum TaxID=1607685 RepID=A0ABV8TYW2_9ACTN